MAIRFYPSKTCDMYQELSLQFPRFNPWKIEFFVISYKNDKMSECPFWLYAHTVISYNLSKKYDMTKFNWFTDLSVWKSCEMGQELSQLFGYIRCLIPWHIIYNSCENLQISDKKNIHYNGRLFVFKLSRGFLASSTHSEPSRCDGCVVATDDAWLTSCEASVGIE